jgi:hypothetical protein
MSSSDILKYTDIKKYDTLIQMYAKAIYRTIMSMTPFYIENLCVWVKAAVWDAPRRIYLDIDLEKHRIEMEQERLSKIAGKVILNE